MKCAHSNARSLWILAVIALAGGCSSIPLDQRMQADRTRYESYAGPPIDHFLWMFRSRDNGWNALSPTELVVWTSPYQVYLLKVAEPCEDLTFAKSLELTTTTLANTVAVRVDFVKVGRFRCPITEIRAVDEKRLRADERNPPAPKPAPPADSAKSNGGT